LRYSSFEPKDKSLKQPLTKEQYIEALDFYRLKLFY